MPKVIYPTLETPRLILRPLDLSDYAATFKWTGDPRVNKFMIYPLYKNAEEAKPWIESLNQDEKKLDYGFVLKESGELIGSGGIYYHEDIDVWGIGYNLAYDFWHKGYTTEAMEKIIEYTRSKFDVRVIAGTFAVDNVGSRRVMEKLGMTFHEDTEYTKMDGSETFKAQTYHRVFGTKDGSKKLFYSFMGNH